MPDFSLICTVESLRVPVLLQPVIPFFPKQATFGKLQFRGCGLSVFAMLMVLQVRRYLARHAVNLITTECHIRVIKLTVLRLTLMIPILLPFSLIS